MIRLGLVYLALAIAVVLSIAGIPGASLFSGKGDRLTEVPPAPEAQPATDGAEVAATAAPAASLPLPLTLSAPANMAGLTEAGAVPEGQAVGGQSLQAQSLQALRSLRAARALTATTGPQAVARIARQASAHEATDPAQIAHIAALRREALLFPTPALAPAAGAVSALWPEEGEEGLGEGDRAEPDLPALARPVSGEFMHLVGPGESLGSLALRYYGDASHYLTLFTANRALLATPDSLRPGQSLLIPDLSQQP